MTEIYKEDINGIIADKNIPWNKLDGKDILITGGTGLLGKLAVHTLIALRRQKSINCRIHVLIRNMEKAKSVFKLKGHRSNSTISLIFQTDYVIKSISKKIFSTFLPHLLVLLFPPYFSESKS